MKDHGCRYLSEVGGMLSGDGYAGKTSIEFRVIKHRPMLTLLMLTNISFVNLHKNGSYSLNFGQSYLYT